MSSLGSNELNTISYHTAQTLVLNNTHPHIEHNNMTGKLYRVSGALTLSRGLNLFGPDTTRGLKAIWFFSVQWFRVGVLGPNKSVTLSK